MYFSTSIVVIVFMYVPSSPPGRAHCLSLPLEQLTDKVALCVCPSLLHLLLWLAVCLVVNGSL